MDGPSDALALIQDKLVGWTKSMIQMLPNLALASLIVVVGALLARLARALTG